MIAKYKDLQYSLLHVNKLGFEMLTEKQLQSGLCHFLSLLKYDSH